MIPIGTESLHFLFTRIFMSIVKYAVQKRVETTSRYCFISKKRVDIYLHLVTLVDDKSQKPRDFQVIPAALPPSSASQI